MTLATANNIYRQAQLNDQDNLARERLIEIRVLYEIAEDRITGLTSSNLSQRAIQDLISAHYGAIARLKHLVQLHEALDRVIDPATTDDAHVAEDAAITEAAGIGPEDLVPFQEEDS